MLPLLRDAVVTPGWVSDNALLAGYGAAHAAPGMRDINAAVVGLLGSALYNPVWVSAVREPAEFVVAATGFVLLVAWRAPPLLVVLLSAAAGMGLVSTQ